MLSIDELDRIYEAYPRLLDDPARRRELADVGTFVRLGGGDQVFSCGSHAEWIALLTEGSVRVFKESETAREITLYRVRPGELCVLTARAILQRASLPAHATVQEPAAGALVPAMVFRRWVEEDREWRDFLFGLFARRLDDLVDLIDDVVFSRLDARLAAHLLERGRGGDAVQATHQQLAGELGSSREVISRLLEDFAARGLIHQSRGRIEIVDAAALWKQSAR